jgi:hypothetical protein
MAAEVAQNQTSGMRKHRLPANSESQGDAFPMLCLSDSRRYDAPCGPPLLRRIAEAPTLAPRILAVWPLARVLALHVVD